MAAGKATQDVILAAVVERLHTQIDELTEDTCILTEDPYPSHSPPGDVFVTVSIGDGNFDEGMFAAGGVEQVFERSAIVVTVFSRVSTDRKDEATGVLLDPERGMLSVWKRKVLQAILKDNWDPVDGNTGLELTRNMFAPLSAGAPQRVEDDGISYSMMSLVFSMDYDWNL